MGGKQGLEPVGGRLGQWVVGVKLPRTQGSWKVEGDRLTPAGGAGGARESEDTEDSGKLEGLCDPTKRGFCVKGPAHPVPCFHQQLE